MAISGEMIKIAKKEGQEAGIMEKITWCTCDAEHLPFKGELFDIVCCTQTFPHLPNPQKDVDDNPSFCLCLARECRVRRNFNGSEKVSLHRRVKW